MGLGKISLLVKAFRIDWNMGMENAIKGLWMFYERESKGF